MSILKKLSKGAKNPKVQKGRFIVIDGIDGSGKATQAKLLVEELKLSGYLVEQADFPQHGTK